ncbi:putative bifunctional diguanylate cyclase/phosphodiesterase [Roseibium suaedae]|uniref:putative bifunctional diguanylate cyclase/phosphodiesterase n=1 Tax=Roseibium suaedae TaxID=735517 RepID=UPI0015881C80|nr:bifunctional diguanylate cyclase/phosphodiesterase [Roseibium suaedae]
MAWAAGLLAVTAFRVIVQFLPARTLDQFQALPPLTKRRWQKITAIGLGFSALLWMIMTFRVTGYDTPSLQFANVLIVASLAAGATGTMAPQLIIGRYYLSALLIQGSVALLFQGGAMMITGLLGFVFWAAMLFGHYRNHLLLRSSIKLSFANSRLVKDVEAERRALEQLNATLEDRVRRRTAELKTRAERDALIGLYNRTGLQQWVSDQSLAPGFVFAVIFIDLDRFKEINAGLGHTIGDAVLSETANRLSKLLPEGAVLARWGGDEFLVACPAHGAMAQQAGLMLANRMREAVELPIKASGQTLHVSFSAGLSLSAPESEAFASAIRASDLAMGQAKRTLRGTTLVYSEHMKCDQERRLMIGQFLRQAVSSKEFSLSFQPIVSSSLQSIEAHEVLLRWNNPVLGSVSPDEFIPIAEESGEIVAIGAYVLDEALHQYAASGSASRSGKLAINLSLLQLVAPGLVDQVRNALAKHRISAHRLVLEVTESIFDDRNTALINTVLTELHRDGIEIHLDDFGTGYSSLSRLHEMPITALKIDKSFVQKGDAQATAIIEGSVLIARQFGIRVIAEGVETLAQAEALQEIGVDALQGYLFSRPVPRFQEAVTVAQIEQTATA